MTLIVTFCIDCWDKHPLLDELDLLNWVLVWFSVEWLLSWCPQLLPSMNMLITVSQSNNLDYSECRANSATTVLFIVYPLLDVTSFSCNTKNAWSNFLPHPYSNGVICSTKPITFDLLSWVLFEWTKSQKKSTSLCLQNLFYFGDYFSCWSITFHCCIPITYFQPFWIRNRKTAHS